MLAVAAVGVGARGYEMSSSTGHADAALPHMATGVPVTIHLVYTNSAIFTDALQ